MRVICVDDEELMLGHIRMKLNQIPEIEEIHCFQRIDDALLF